MSERPSYVCRDCKAAVSSGSYRAACPECGGSLRPRAYAGSHARREGETPQRAE